MLPTKGYAAKSATSILEPFSFERREIGANDVLIAIDFCGICHSDIHSVRNEWGGAKYPIVPGHEIVGHVTRIGNAVKKYKVGDLVGVGCFVDSCRTCANCKRGDEQFCDNDFTATYNSHEKNGNGYTFGGYSSQVVVDENYVLRVPKNLPLDGVAPLLCAGITTYSPLKRWNVQKGQHVGVVGLGGLGHMAVKIAVAMGAEVTVLSSSRSKEKDAKRLGAHNYAATNEEKTFADLTERFDFMIDTVSAAHDLNAYLGLLKVDATMVLVGAPPQPAPVSAFSLIGRRRNLAGSLIGGIRETQEALDFCSNKNIVADVEVIAAKDVNTAYERMLKGDVRYRFVINSKTI